MTDERKAVPTEDGYEFSASAVERTLINKINNTASHKQIENKPKGRSIDELKASLYKKLL